MQFFRRGTAVSARTVPALLDSRGACRRRLQQIGGDAGAGHAAHDGCLAVPTLALLRCVRTRLPARGVPRQRHSVALGKYESGVRSLSTVGGVSPAANDSRGVPDAKAEVADFGDGGRQARASVLLSFIADPRRAG